MFYCLETLWPDTGQLNMFLSVLIYSVLVTIVLGAYRCPSDSVVFAPEGKCITYHSTAKSFQDAIQECQGVSQGSLVKVNSEAKADALVEAMADAFLWDVWIGVHDPNGDFVFNFVDATALTSYTPWAQDPEVSRTAGYECAMSSYATLRRSWIAQDCATEMKFVCEYNAEEYTPLCDPGWYLNREEDACIKAMKRMRKNFNGASEYCQKLEGSLATSMSTRSQISNAMAQINFRAHFWIGVTDPAKNGNFEFVDGTALESRVPWQKGRPKGSKHCVTLKLRRWYDKNCSRRHFFICQKTPEIPPENKL